MKDSNKAKIATTISPDDKKFLEQAGLNASTALSIGVKVLRNAVRASISISSIRSLANLAITSPTQAQETEARARAPWFPMFTTLEEYEKAKKESGWKSIEEMRESFGDENPSINFVEEDRNEEDKDLF